MHQGHTEFRARPQQPGIGERTAVVDIDPGRNPAGGQCGAQRGGQAHGVFGKAEPVAGQQPGVVVNEGEQEGFAVSDPRPVQGIPAPELVGFGGLEPAEHRRGLAGGRSHQLQPVEMAQQGRLRGRPPGGGTEPGAA